MASVGDVERHTAEKFHANNTSVMSEIKTLEYYSVFEVLKAHWVSVEIRISSFQEVPIFLM